MSKHTPLPAWAEPDAEGISTYPRLLSVFGGAEKLHIASEDSYGNGPLCGGWSARKINLVEYIGRRRPVCAKCRKIANAAAKTQGES